MTEFEVKAREYFLEKDNNCAESTLRIANDLYGFGLDGEAIRLVSAFGGGMGCGKTCGALCGAMAAIGEKTVTDRAHTTENFKEICSGFVERFQKEFGSCDCAEVKPAFFVEGERCVNVVSRTAKLLDEYLKELEDKKA